MSSGLKSPAEATPTTKEIPEPLTIVASAIKRGDVVYSVPRPGRHGDVIIYMRDKCGVHSNFHTQGFLTSRNTFVDREEAARIALAAGQTQKLKFQPNQLFSEDLW